ncbi:MAG: DUF1207 domain-containing protein [Candidatus Kryptonium sp.]
MQGIFNAFLILIFVSVLNSQVKIVESNGLNFEILRASYYEPKLGIMKYFNRNSLKVDIGNSLDLIEFKKENFTLTVGVDFFAYTLVNNHGFLILRVEAVDGFFGGNLSFRSESFSSRFRVLHRSAHIVDEYGELEHKPFPFTGEFFDLIFVFTKKFYKLYSGFSQVFRIKPSSVDKFYFQTGFELFKEFKISNLIFACDVKFIDRILGFNTVAGFKIGRLSSRGIFVYVNFYSGFDIYGQYFNLKKEFGGLGCSLEF